MRRLIQILVVAATALGPTVVAVPSALANERSHLTVTSYVTGSPQQSPSETFKRLKAGASPQELGLLDRPASLAEGGLVRRTGPAGLGAEYVRASTSPSSEVAVSPQGTDPIKRTMTLAECKAHTAEDASMWIPSRFAMCESQWFAAKWLRNGKVVGFSQMTATAIATIAANSRDIHFDYYFSDFYQAGVQAIDATLVGGVSDYESVPSDVTLSQGGLDPGPRTVAEIKADPHFMISRRADPGQGLSPDDGVWAVWNMEFVPVYPPPWVDTNPLAEWDFSSFGVRWDNASYLPNYNPTDILHTGGASFSYNVSPLRYSTATGAEEKAVADHINKAFTQPASTMPRNPSKNAPGQSASDPLHRLQPDLGQTNKNRYNANRREAIKVCTAVDPDYASKGLQCDEYPFASTYEGAAQSIYEPDKPKKNFSALAVPKNDNQKAGSQLATYYNNRIIDGEYDGFYVQTIS